MKIVLIIAAVVLILMALAIFGILWLIGYMIDGVNEDAEYAFEFERGDSHLISSAKDINDERSLHDITKAEYPHSARIRDLPEPMGM